MTVPVPPPPPRARSRPSGWAVLAVAATLALVLIAVLALRGPTGGEQVAAPGASAPAATAPATPAPSASEEATAEPSPSAPASPHATPSPLPGPRPEGIDEIAEQVASLRGLPLEGRLDARVVPSPELGAKLTDLAFAEQDREQLTLDGRLLAALRLLEPGDDLAEIVEAFYREQILGLYVMEEDVLYVGGDDARLSAGQRITAAHEVLHALQDRSFDLESFMDLDETDTDAQLAALALVEGDAVLTQELWTLRHQSPGERQDAMEEAGGRASEALAAAPPYVRATLLFPYQDGYRFVQALFEQGGFEAVDAAFDDPPRSTRHILRPETYLAGEQPADVAITAAPGEGWEEAATYTFGEFDVAQWLAGLGDGAVAVTAAWDGGLVRHWRRGEDDGVALALRLSSPEGAAAACHALPAWYAAAAGGVEAAEGLHRGDRDWMAWTCDGAEVRLGLGPDADAARALAAP